MTELTMATVALERVLIAKRMRNGAFTLWRPSGPVEATMRSYDTLTEDAVIVWEESVTEDDSWYTAYDTAAKRTRFNGL